MRVALVVGHDAQRPGAWCETLQVHEHPWCSRLASQLLGELQLRGLEAAIFLRTPGLGYSAQMREVCDRVNAYTGTGGCVLSLHFNAAEDAQWAGGCALHWPSSTQGAALAGAVAAAASAALANRNRGPIAQARSWGPGRPSLYILQWTQSPAAICEPFFGSNETDSQRAEGALEGGELAHNIAAAVLAWSVAG